MAVKAISIGMFVEDGAAVSWRGPMLHRTMQQFVTDVFWGDLDVLLLDLPPGTGDVAISLGQLLPQAEVLVVTTPQAAAADVAARSAVVARQTGQTVIGVVETMTGDLFGCGRRRVGRRPARRAAARVGAALGRAPRRRGPRGARRASATRPIRRPSRSTPSPHPRDPRARPRRPRTLPFTTP